MELNKFISASLVIGSLALVGCGDEQKKESDKVVEVPATTTNHEAPKTDAPATDMAKSGDAVVITPAPAHDAAVVTPPAVTETPSDAHNSNVIVEEPKTETKPLN